MKKRFAYIWKIIVRAARKTVLGDDLTPLEKRLKREFSFIVLDEKCSSSSLELENFINNLPDL